ncbi:Chloroperoxidase [Entophlyctis helioformis]|nr:Chloroperoxidase [Entophlyctis helioformis]
MTTSPADATSVQASDVRSPCPAWNALANHGVFSRDGKQRMPRKFIVEALFFHFHLDHAVGNKLLDAAFRLGLGDAESQTISLEDLRKHNAIEHDASLVRKDDYLGDNSTADQGLVNQLVSSSTDGKVVTLWQLGKFRAARYNDSKANNPTFKFDRFQHFVAYSESAILVGVIKAFMGEERLPIEEGWVKPAAPFTSLTAQLLMLRLKTAAMLPF